MSPAMSVPSREPSMESPYPPSSLYNQTNASAYQDHQPQSYYERPPSSAQDFHGDSLGSSSSWSTQARPNPAKISKEIRKSAPTAVRSATSAPTIREEPTVASATSNTHFRRKIVPDKEDNEESYAQAVTEAKETLEKENPGIKKILSRMNQGELDRLYDVYAYRTLSASDPEFLDSLTKNDPRSPLLDGQSLGQFTSNRDYFKDPRTLSKLMRCPIHQREQLVPPSVGLFAEGMSDYRIHNSPTARAQVLGSLIWKPEGDQQDVPDERKKRWRAALTYFFDKEAHLCQGKHHIIPCGKQAINRIRLDDAIATAGNEAVDPPLDLPAKILYEHTAVGLASKGQEQEAKDARDKALRPTGEVATREIVAQAIADAGQDNDEQSRARSLEEQRFGQALTANFGTETIEKLESLGRRMNIALLGIGHLQNSAAYIAGSRSNEDQINLQPVRKAIQTDTPGERSEIPEWRPRRDDFNHDGQLVVDDRGYPLPFRKDCGFAIPDLEKLNPVPRGHRFEYMADGKPHYSARQREDPQRIFYTVQYVPAAAMPVPIVKGQSICPDWLLKDFVEQSSANRLHLLATR